MNRDDTAKILCHEELWIVDVDDVRYAFTRYWLAPLPECVANLLTYWNLDPEPGSYEFVGKRATRSVVPAPDPARLLSDPPKSPAVERVLFGGQETYVSHDGETEVVVLTNGGDNIYANRGYLNVATDGQWRDRPMAGKGPKMPLAIWNEDKPTIIMPIRVAS